MREWLTARGNILLILLIAFVLRAGLVGWLHDLGGYTGDEREYILLAQKLAEGKPFVDSNGEWATKAPLYPFLLSVVFRVFGMNLVAAHGLNIIFGVLTVWLGYFLCMRLFDDRGVAVIAAGAMTLYPGLVVYSDLLQSEALYIVLLMVLFSIAEAMQSRMSASLAIAFGAIAGMANLTRAVMTGYVPLLVLTLGWVMHKRADQVSRKLVLATLTWLVVLVPWTWRNYHVLGAIVPVSSWGGMSMVLGNNPYSSGTWKPNNGFGDWFEERARANGLSLSATTEIDRSELGRKLAVEFWQTEPMQALKLAAKKLYMHVAYPITNTDSFLPLQALAVGFDIIAYLFAGLGVIAVGARRKLIPIFSAIFFFSLLQIVLHCEARYRLPIMPFVLMFTAVGIGMVTNTHRRADFLHIPKKMTLAIVWCMIVCGIYVFTAWQFVTGTI